ncbi:TEA domain family member 1/3/4 [Pseudohyphozyma bogoriensis]|nr:TEA domain family member 1/3/4 [Pseudohyphozyma bogoriensis]
MDHSRQYSGDLHMFALQHTPAHPATQLLSSPGLDTPSAGQMARKRTLNDMGSFPHVYDHHHPIASSSPNPNIPSFEFDPAHPAPDAKYHPHAHLSSSPMMLHRSNNSSRSSLSHHDDYEHDQLDHDDDDDELAPPPYRPEVKRRRTAPDVMAVPSTPVRGYKQSPKSVEKRGNGKDGQDVWPPEIEEAFHTALTIIPKLGRKKIMVHGKPCGRNELIADYIKRKTGEVRSRKQVSSHIQVLKNMKKNDAEFMALVSEPAEGEDNFSPGAAMAFFGLSASEMESYGSEDALLSPYSSTYLRRSMSAGSARSPDPSPARSPLPQDSLSPVPPPSQSRPRHIPPPRVADVVQPHLHAPPHSPQPISAPMSATSSLTSAMNDMHFPTPPPHERMPIICPIAPSSFCLWADDTESDAMHVFAELEEAASTPSGNTLLEDLTTQEREFPGLVAMFEHLPCQFLHVKLDLDVPTTDATDVATQLHTQLKVTSLQDLNLTTVTRIYSFGHQVLSLVENLDRPTRILPHMRPQLNSAASSPASPASPLTPGSRNASPTGTLKHKYSYNAPFVSDFWSIFLRGAFSSEGGSMLPSFAKSGEERDAFVMALSGLSVIQEFVVRSDEPSTTPLIEGQSISPGSELGDVVLVVTYHFECEEAGVRSAGKANVSFLTVKSEPASASLSRSQSQNSAVADARPYPTADLVEQKHVSSLASPPNIRTHTHTRTGSASKPNLSLRIPPPASFSATAVNAPSSAGSISPVPYTPWPQLLHTPAGPPPVVAMPTAAYPGAPPRDDRLERIWARDSNEWELSSPALLGAFPHSNSTDPAHHRVSSQAMNDMTTRAIAAGTPVLSTFPPSVTSSHGAPFIHPSHNYSHRDELASPDRAFLKGEEAASSLSASSLSRPSAKDPVRIVVDGEEQPEDEDSKVNIQEYFTNLLGSSTRYAGTEKGSLKALIS